MSALPASVTWLLPLYDSEEDRVPVLFGVLRISPPELREALALRDCWQEAHIAWPELCRAEVETSVLALRVVQAPEALEIRHQAERTPFGLALESLVPADSFRGPRATSAALPHRSLPRGLLDVEIQEARLHLGEEGLAWGGIWETPTLRVRRRSIWTAPLAWSDLLGETG